MCWTWCATVRSESDRRAATTRLGAPRAARRSTSTSRAVSEETNREAGTTIVLTTHDIRDVERLCRALPGQPGAGLGHRDADRPVARAARVLDGRDLGLRD